MCNVIKLSKKWPGYHFHGIQVYGDNVFEKTGINRDEAGGPGKDRLFFPALEARVFEVNHVEDFLLCGVREEPEHGNHTLNGEPKTVATFRKIVEAGSAKVYVYFDDTVSGMVGDVQLVDTDGDVVAKADHTFEKPPSKAFQGVAHSFHPSNYQLSKQRKTVVCPLTSYHRRTSRTIAERFHSHISPKYRSQPDRRRRKQLNSRWAVCLSALFVPCRSSPKFSSFPGAIRVKLPPIKPVTGP